MNMGKLGSGRGPGRATSLRATSAWWRSPRLHRAVFEILLLLTAWKLYRLGRYLVRDQRASAFDNAAEVRGFEALLGLDVEQGLQRLVSAHQGAIVFFNHYYVIVHFPLTVGVLCWLFLHDVDRYSAVRRALIGAMAVGLAIHALYPLAPPRMVAASGMTDTLAVYGPRVYSRDHFASVTNQFAAMPSFHVGWSLLCAAAVMASTRSRRRMLALVHPVVTFVAVVVTANHYVVDGLVGCGLILGALLVEERVRTRSASQVSRPPAAGRALSADG